MSEVLDDRGAASALAAAVSADQGTPVAPTNTAPPPADANQPAPPAPEVEGTPAAPAEDSSLIRSADISLDSLAPDARSWLEAREKEMQAVMTKRTQEAAETLKQYEGLEDPTQAREALAFYKGIQEDPNYAAEVYDFLTQNLTAAGYSPAQAAAKALETMGDSEETALTPPAPKYEDDPDEAITQRLALLDAGQKKIDARFAAAEAREQESLLVNRILQQDSAIRQSNPSLTDNEMDYVYQLAEATQGDLFAAHETYKGIQEATVRNYLASKENVVSPAPPATPPASILTTPKTLDEGYRMGLERLRNEMAANT